MRELDFSKENIAGGWEVVKDFWGDGLREKVLKLVKRTLGRVLVEEVKGVIGCKRYQRSKARKGYRNGSYGRDLLTSYGWLEDLKVPRVRDMSFRPSVWDRYKRRQKALDGVILEAFLLGDSTRKTARLFKLAFGGLISAQTVSNVIKLLDEEVVRFHTRRFEDSYRVLILDGLWIKVASPFPVWKVVLMALGVRHDGKKELLSFQVVPSEKECHWWGFLSDLKSRGLGGENLEVVVHDGAGGLSSATSIVYPRARVQRCIFHKVSNIATHLRNFTHRRAILKDASHIYEADSGVELKKRLRSFCAKWSLLEPKAVKNFLTDFELTLTYLDYPPPWRTLIRTTNHIERIFEEFERRIKPMRRFANQKSAERILYGLIFYVLNENQQDMPPTNNFTQLS
jgi:putative transposase